MSKIYTEQKATTLQELHAAVERAIILYGSETSVQGEVDIFDEDETFVGHIADTVEGL